MPAAATPHPAMAEIRALIAAHATPDLRTAVPGLYVSRVESAPPDFSLTEPLVVLMAQGAKRLHLGERVFEYAAGQCLVVTADLPVTGHFVGASRAEPSLSLGLTIRPEVVSALLLRADASPGRSTVGPAAMATSDADGELLDSFLRLLRLLARPADVPVLFPLVEQEILWRLLNGPHGAMVRQIGLADSSLAHVNRAIGWIRDNYAEPMRVADLASMAGMSPSAFHRHFRAITALSPLQFQKRIRLQEARALLVSRAGDVAGVGHLVGYDSPTQFNREYRRLFGAPPGADATALRARAARPSVQHLP